MSKIALEGNSLGSGTFTIAAPNSNSNPTLTLPTSSGTVVVTGGAQTIEFAAGTAAAPSITFTGDTNTGIFSPGADTIAFSEGGVESMRINSSGNVGIGTTNPAAGSSGATRILNLAAGATAGTSSLTFGDLNAVAYVEAINGSSCALNINSGNYIAFGTGSPTERMRIDSSGNVGIGTTSPSTAANGGLTLGTTSAGKSLILNSSSSGNNGLIRFIDSNGSASLEFVGGTSQVSLYGYGSRDMQFYTNGAERARITSGGYFKASNNGGYVDAAGSYHELNGNATSSPSLVVYNSNGSFANNLVQFRAARNTTNGTFSAITYYNETAAEFRFRVYDSGQLMSVGSYNNTTASAANLFIASNYDIARSTSSIKYKTQVENLDSSHADAILNFRPVWYRSLCNNDNANWSWYGLIAEEVAAIEPRLVHWGYSEEDYEVVETQEEVQKERTITGEDGAETVETYTETETKKNKQLKADAQLKPEGVQYDRLTVLLLDIVKRQDKRIEALEAEVAALKGQ